MALIIVENGIRREMTASEEMEYRELHENQYPAEPTPEERMEAQVLYTALMTDTLLEV